MLSRVELSALLQTGEGAGAVSSGLAEWIIPDFNSHYPVGKFAFKFLFFSLSFSCFFNLKSDCNNGAEG